MFRFVEGMARYPPCLLSFRPLSFSSFRVLFVYLLYFMFVLCLMYLLMVIYVFFTFEKKFDCIFARLWCGIARSISFVGNVLEINLKSSKA